MNDLVEAISAIVGAGNVLIGSDAARYGADVKHSFGWVPLAVARPADTGQVAALIRAAAAAGIAVVPISGNTGLNGGTHADGALMISLERMNRIIDIRPEARIAVVEAGVVLSQLHDAAAAQGLTFPLTFGARGSAMIGGCLSTNAGGSNVLRYGNSRSLTLGVEVVLADGRVLNLMSALHKDNTGYDLRDLFIGAEGTLGIITAAVLKLVPTPGAYATAMVSAASVPAALSLLNRLQQATGGMVEAFEYMPRVYLTALRNKKPDLVPPLGYDRDHTVMVELGATAARDVSPRPDGSSPVTSLLEDALAALIDEGLADDAVIAQNQSQRQHMWAMRECAGEVIFAHDRAIDTDVSVPLDAVEDFIRLADQGRERLDPGSAPHVVSHLGDGNIHYSIFASVDDPSLNEKVREMVEDVAGSLGGSFSAEHGIGLSKRAGMARRKDPVALQVMWQIKRALDPQNLMNPGKVLPDDPLASRG